MDFTGASSLYDVLEIAPDATPQDVRAAYLRAKNAYRSDSVALYSLMSAEETQELLARIEFAYQVLSSPEKRREYDRNFGRVDEDSQVDRAKAVQSIVNSDTKVVSIDRVPPMDSGASTMEDLLVAPSTDFTAARPQGSRGSTAVFGVTEAPLPAFTSQAQPQAETPAQPRTPAAIERGWIESPAVPQAPTRPSQPAPQTPVHDAFAAPVPHAASPPPAHSLAKEGRQTPSSSPKSEELAVEIARETEWTGAFFRKIREARAVSIEELSDFTKISKTYLLAVEEENFAKLPAVVYLRGFITQFCKALKLPADKAVPAYVNRYLAARPDKK